MSMFRSSLLKGDAMPNVFKKVTIYVENDNGDTEILTIERTGDIQIEERYTDPEEQRTNLGSFFQVPELDKLVIEFDVYKTPDGITYTIQRMDKDGNPRGS